MTIYQQKKKKINFFDFPRIIIEKIWEMDYLTPDLEKTDEELKSQAKLNFNGLLGRGFGNLSAIKQILGNI